MKNGSIRLLFLLCCCLFLLFLFFPDIVQTSAHESVLFSATVLIPSLFPGFVLADLLISLTATRNRKSRFFEKLFHLPAAMERCFLIGILAGFPAAADCAIQSYNRGDATKEQTERCLSFTNNPGIVFIVCAVGSGLFGSLGAGIYLWGIQTISALLVGVSMAGPQEQNSPKRGDLTENISIKQLLPKAVVSSVSSVLNICGFVIFFRTVISILTFPIPLGPTQTFLAGLLEMTCGISQLSNFDYTAAQLASFLLGWSGFSVHFQILNRIAKDDLSVRYYFPGKVLQAILSTGLTASTYPMLFSYTKTSVQAHIATITLVIFLIAMRLRKELLWKTKSFDRKKNV